MARKRSAWTWSFRGWAGQEWAGYWRRPRWCCSRQRRLAQLLDPERNQDANDRDDDAGDALPKLAKRCEITTDSLENRRESKGIAFDVRCEQAVRNHARLG